MSALELPVYPTRARCLCTHALYAHGRSRASTCASEGCSCRRFEPAGGLVPLEIDHTTPLDARSINPTAALLD